MASEKLAEQFTMFEIWIVNKIMSNTHLVKKGKPIRRCLEHAYDSVKKDNRDLGAEAPSVRFLFAL